jgi:P27 family predicted phage terminase small subunit
MRPRKPLDVHALQGTMPNYYSEPAQSQFPAGRPRMPKDLSAVAQLEWKRMVRELARRKTLTAVDASALALYCETHARYRACLIQLDKDSQFIETTWTDSGGAVQSKLAEHPASKLCTRLENSLRQFLKEFSATPASRDKAKPAKPPAPKERGKTAEELELEAGRAFLDGR